jgi:hypothetical protein
MGGVSQSLPIVIVPAPSRIEHSGILIRTGRIFTTALMAEPQYSLPPLGQNPSSTNAGPTPGSFAKKPIIRPGVEGRLTFASPDTPGMPEPSEKTAWDFLPPGWGTERFAISDREVPFRRTGHYLP